MKQIWKKFFNPNVGYYLKQVYYQYNDERCVGYVICRGFIFFGLFGYDKIECCVDMREVNETLSRLNITLTGEYVF